VTAQLRTQIPIDASQATQSFAVVPEGTFFSLEAGYVKFARLRKGLCSVFHTIAETKQFHLRAFVPTKELRAADQSWSRNSAPTFPAEINLYGSESDAAYIGAALSKAGIFIQFPRHEQAISRYYNPHILRIEGHDSHSLASTGRDISTADTSSGSHSHAVDRDGGVIDEANPANHGAVVESILDSLTHDVQVNEIPVDRRIKQTLYP
jgi:hypothetical protein